MKHLVTEGCFNGSVTVKWEFLVRIEERERERECLCMSKGREKKEKDERMGRPEWVHVRSKERLTKSE